MGRIVLVTGVSSDLGGRLALSLAQDPAFERVIGVDLAPPHRELGGVDFVRVDMRNPVIAKVVAGQGVDTVVHMSVQPTPDRTGRGGHGPSPAGRSFVKEHNVIGTMQLLAAAQTAPGLERLVVRSSAAVYGSSSRDPALFTEDMAAKRMPRSGFGKDVLEVEGYVRGFTRRRPDVAVTMLRPADLVGPRIESPLTDYLRMPVVPTPLGFDARLQLLHEDDLLAVLRLATHHGVHGTFNLAGDGVLMLSQALRRLGRPSISVPPAALQSLRSMLGPVGVSGPDRELAAYLTFGRGVDTSQARRLLGFTPQHTTESAFADFAGSTGRSLVDVGATRG
ncbi:MAG: NAD-dependent epimerase/dehydratase family protein [Nocardioidaceae bacterium]|nr:NAD-dependent epimerase/dehydratase family protein [Nocardioidaceae bacterium]